MICQNRKSGKEDIHEYLLQSEGINDTQHTNNNLMVLSGLSVPEIVQKPVLNGKTQKYSGLWNYGQRRVSGYGTVSFVDDTLFTTRQSIRKARTGFPTAAFVA